MTNAESDRGTLKSPHPWVWSVLYFPYGLSIGFPSIALGFLGHKAGLSTSLIASIVGWTFFAAGWKFLWAPIADYTLSRKKWYAISAATVSIGLLALTTTPLTARSVPLISLLVFLTSFAATFIAFATEGLLAHNTLTSQRGRAAGWFQSGNQFGQTAGGGISLWLMNHVPSPWMAGAALALLLCACATTLMLVEEPPRKHGHLAIGERAADAWRNLREIIGSRLGRVGLILAVLPIGTGASQYLFGSLGTEFHAPADAVSAVLGAGGGLAIVIGCFVGGRLSDRIEKSWSYALCCGLGLIACVVLVFSPRTSLGYAAGTLFYTFTLGMVASSFTSLVLAIIGRGAAATKINLFFAINTLFSLGVLRAAGWAHDAWGTSGMLYTEALLGVGALVIFAAVSSRVRGAELAAES
jgi:PAT family beta-lactamase induction signal transducer AmpG